MYRRSRPLQWTFTIIDTCSIAPTSRLDGLKPYGNDPASGVPPAPNRSGSNPAAGPRNGVGGFSRSSTRIQQDHVVDTPGQEPRQGQWELSNCGNNPLLHRHFRQEGQHSLIPDGPAWIDGWSLFFFGAGQYNLRFTIRPGSESDPPGEFMRVARSSGLGAMG
jgi:hypothetical protein